MPYRPQKSCAWFGCPEVVPAAQRFCAYHNRKQNRKYDANRLTATQRGYTNTWHKVREIKLAHDPLCEQCQSEGLIIPAILVHHKDRNPKNNIPSNLESLCFTCHEQRHKDDRWRKQE